MKIVISLGGSLLYPLNEEYIKNFANFIKNHDEEFYIVTGGGKIARDYIRIARKLGGNEKYLDEIGIMVTRLNAMILNTFFNKKVPYKIEEASKMAPPVIMGGTMPGHSTDAVAAMLAKAVKADILIIATDVDGIYDKDPKKFRDARVFEKISIKKLMEMVGKGWEKAGENVIIDAIACKIIEEGKIKTIVLNGRDLNQLENAIYGKRFKGTEIVI